MAELVQDFLTDLFLCAFSRYLRRNQSTCTREYVKNSQSQFMRLRRNFYAYGWSWFISSNRCWIESRIHWPAANHFAFSWKFFSIRLKNVILSHARARAAPKRSPASQPVGAWILINFMNYVDSNDDKVWCGHRIRDANWSRSLRMWEG